MVDNKEKEHKVEHKVVEKDQKSEPKMVHHHNAGEAKIKKSTVWQIIALVLGVGLIVSIAFNFAGSGSSSSAIDKDAAAKKAVDYINSNLLAPGTSAELVSVVRDGDLYKMKLQIGTQEFDSYVSLDGAKLYPSAVELTEGTPILTNTTQPETETNTTQTTTTGNTTTTAPAQKEGTFTVNSDPVCKEGGKPLIMLFSTTWCPHCKWIKDTFDATAKSYGDKIAAYHWELDTKDNTLTNATETAIPAELEAYYNKYNPGGSIPTFVFGCKYSRIGNGYEQSQNLTAESAEFTKIIDELVAAN